MVKVLNNITHDKNRIKIKLLPLWAELKEDKK